VSIHKGLTQFQMPLDTRDVCTELVDLCEIHGLLKKQLKTRYDALWSLMFNAYL